MKFLIRCIFVLMIFMFHDVIATPSQNVNVFSYPTGIEIVSNTIVSGDDLIVKITRTFGILSGGATVEVIDNNINIYLITNFGDPGGVRDDTEEIYTVQNLASGQYILNVYLKVRAIPDPVFSDNISVLNFNNIPANIPTLSTIGHLALLCILSILVWSNHKYSI